MEIIKNLYDQDIVIIENEDGSIISMIKSAYDELKANEAETL